VSILLVYATLDGMGLCAIVLLIHPRPSRTIQNLVFKVVLVMEVVFKENAFATWVGLDQTATKNQTTHSSSFCVRTIVPAEVCVSMGLVFVTLNI
jgi:hypothetical protein